MNAMIVAVVALVTGLAVAGPADPQSALSGKVKETLDAGTYTYVLIATKKGDQWAAIVKTALKKGAEVEVLQETVMENFESKTLGRKFDRVVFGVLESAPPAGGPHAGMTARAQSHEGPVKPVAKAEGPEGRTVAEVFAQKTGLSGKTVLVRGRVVKYSANILGSNWLHLRDGSGSSKEKNDDIAVATEDAAAIGDVVSVRGNVVLDKNLGAGYVYPVLLDKARIAK